MVFCQVNHVFPQFRGSMASNCDNNEDSDEYFEPEDEYLSPEDSYIEPEDDYIEDDDEIISDWQKITIRVMIFSTLVWAQICLRLCLHIVKGFTVSYVGPGIIGHEPFDRQCIFGNEVQMTYLQMCQLSCYVEEFPAPPIKHYVSRLISTQIKKIGMQDGKFFSLVLNSFFC